MNQFDRSYFQRRADEERARAHAQQGTTAAIFYHKLADAYEREAGGASRLAASGPHASSQHV
ncbi:hypothetical protein [Sphingomonas colocasiae]|uniref:DUF4167 domain-containing protein n=1 Tax=Sphingomonas colocasiae TaxID=1848973 RepID=A0ABS7PYI7_9SPHN|nr:hypothetical protein [Sphingomonas colocasiae]MBY8826371.1 hypothetical protein [Sphingomonas colocasiae]